MSAALAGVMAANTTLPVIGVPFALAALWTSGQVRMLEKSFWNPAKPHRICGCIGAATGTVFWFAIIALIIYHSASHGGQGGMHGYGDE